MKRFVITTALLLTFALGVNAQPVSKPVLSETAARLYLQYFNDDFDFRLDYESIKQAYTQMRNYERNYAREELLGKRLKRANGLTGHFWMTLWSADSLLIEVYKQLQETNVMSSAVVRRRLKEHIRDFRTQSEVLPTFYGLIDRDFNGNSDAYVDDLFDNTVFKDKKVFNAFRYFKSAERLREDPLVLFDISRMQFMGRILIEQPNALKKK